ncbi:MAG: ABC transporter permease subunit [Clostridia bacterium]|mgnify:CR=1 FL=1|jgi:ABC-type transport system involved in multi-copper enzyme maturation permease subunit|nr:ABC transporter permease subunit [Clostridia bacterium]
MLSIKKENLRINPVLLKELKVKMRSWKAAILIGVYNLVLTLLTIFITKISMDEHTMIVDTSVILGIYTFMSVMQFGMITLISPALTAGAIAGEREKQTLDILLSTTMKHRSIIVGKLLASLSHIILLVVSSLPTFSIIFLYGAIGVKELLQMFLFYIVTALTFGSIGIFFSTFFKKSTAANVLSYAVIVFLFIGTILISIFYIYLVIMPKTNYNYNGTFFLFYLNPGIALASLLSSQFSEGLGRIFPGLFISGKQSGVQLWHINMIVNLLISYILIFLSARKLKPAKKK